MAKETINVIDIRSDKIICLVAQEIQLLDKGKLTQLIGVGVSRLPVTCQKPLALDDICLLYTSPSPRDLYRSRMPSSA